MTRNECVGCCKNEELVRSSSEKNVCMCATPKYTVDDNVAARICAERAGARHSVHSIAIDHGSVLRFRPSSGLVRLCEGSLCEGMKQPV